VNQTCDFGAPIIFFSYDVQNALGCLFRYSSCASSISSSEVTGRQYPIKLTRPSAAPLNSFDAMVTEHRGSANISCVWALILEKEKIGRPSLSGANPTTLPPGNPGLLSETARKLLD